MKHGNLSLSQASYSSTFLVITMKGSVFIVYMAFLCAISGFAGTITGNVHAEGKAGVDTGDAGSGGAYASRKYKFVTKVDYSNMRDFVIYLEGTVGTNSELSTNVVVVNTRRIAQHGAIFSPHVLPVMVGTTVEWPNDDD